MMKRLSLLLAALFVAATLFAAPVIASVALHRTVDRS